MSTPTTPYEEVAPKGVTLRDWEDMPAARANIFNAAHAAISRQFPQSYGGVRLEMHDLEYVDPEEYDKSEQKDALMGGKFLHRRLRGTYRLFDEKTGEMLDEKTSTIMKVPYLTERGTFIHGGSEYATLNQARLMPGVYTRRKASGELETHFNARRGSGTSFHVTLEPSTGVFKMNLGQASMKLYPLLKDIGVPDTDMKKAWGDDLFRTNSDAYDARVFEKAYTKLVRKPDLAASREQKALAIREALATTKLSREVTALNLPNLFNSKVASEWKDDRQPLDPEDVLKPISPISPIRPYRSPLVGFGDINSEDDEDSDTSLSLGPDEATSTNSETGVYSKDDLIAIAMLLNKLLHAGIPLDEKRVELANDILEVVNEQMPGVHPELAVPKKAAVSSAVIASAARDTDTTPTQAQREAGNYRKGTFPSGICGKVIVIENPKGSVRSGKDKGGHKWSVRMKTHYGYLRGVEAKDGEALDVFVGPAIRDEHPVYVINQNRIGTGKFDEHKVMLGFPDKESAKDAYMSNFTKGWKGFGSMVEFTQDEFSRLVDTWNFKSPATRSILANGIKKAEFCLYDRLVMSKQAFTTAVGSVPLMIGGTQGQQGAASTTPKPVPAKKPITQPATPPVTQPTPSNTNRPVPTPAPNRPTQAQPPLSQPTPAQQPVSVPQEGVAPEWFRTGIYSHEGLPKNWNPESLKPKQWFTKATDKDPATIYTGLNLKAHAPTLVKDYGYDPKVVARFVATRGRSGGIAWSHLNHLSNRQVDVAVNGAKEWMGERAWTSADTNTRLGAASLAYSLGMPKLTNKFTDSQKLFQSGMVPSEAMRQLVRNNPELMESFGRKSPRGLFFRTNFQDTVIPPHPPTGIVR